MERKGNSWMLLEDSTWHCFFLQQNEEVGEERTKDFPSSKWREQVSEGKA